MRHVEGRLNRGANRAALVAALVARKQQNVAMQEVILLQQNDEMTMRMHV